MLDTELQTVKGGVAGLQSVFAESRLAMALEARRPDDVFLSKAAVGRIGPIAMAKVYCASAYTARRQRGVDGDATLLTYTQNGKAFLRGRRCAEMRTGRLMLINGAQPLEISKEEPLQAFTMRLPTRLLARDLGAVDDFCMTPLCATEGAPALLRDMMECLWRRRGDSADSAAEQVASTLSLLIGAAFRGAGGQHATHSLSSQAHFFRIRDLVLEHLENALLSTDFIADRLSLSKGYVFAIMKQANTTPGAYILAQRLERAHGMLQGAASRKRSISEIAYAVGFRDAQHFSRRFAEKYGLPPRAFRARMFSPSEP